MSRLLSQKAVTRAQTPGSDYELLAARYRAILKRPKPGGRGHEIPAAKRPFAACGKLNAYVSHFTTAVLSPN